MYEISQHAIKIKKESLDKEIADAVQSLLIMARDYSFNTISDNCKFILSEIKHSDKNFFVQNKIRRTNNHKKTPKPLTDTIVELENFFSNIYDINLCIYKAQKYSTIIEIQYYLRSSLDLEYQKTSATQEAMIHCKVAVPPYASDRNEKFDINWQLGKLHHQWKMIWWKMGIRHK